MKHQNGENNHVVKFPRANGIFYLQVLYKSLITP